MYGYSDIQDSSTGQSFPSQVTLTNDGKTYNLNATGVATRKKFIVKVYSIASYLQSDAAAGADKFSAFLDANNARQLVLKWVHDASLDKVKSAWNDGFINNLNASELAALQPTIDQFTAFFTQDAKPGDEYVFSAYPNGLVEVSINGKKAGGVTNKDFSKALWSIWFGPSSVVSRDNLVSNLK